jgi:hypothetical protein
MLNQAIIVGRVVDYNAGYVFITSQRNFRNKEGIYETDKIKIYIPKNFNMTNLTFEVDSIIAVKCRMEQEFFDKPLVLVAEKISTVDSGIDKVLEEA